MAKVTTTVFALLVIAATTGCAAHPSQTPLTVPEWKRRCEAQGGSFMLGPDSTRACLTPDKPARRIA